MGSEAILSGLLTAWRLTCSALRGTIRAMVKHDDQYNRDIARAEREAQKMRNGGPLGRVLWLIVEQNASTLSILADDEHGLAAIRTAIDQLPTEGGMESALNAIRETIANLPTSTPGPVLDALKLILDFIIGMSGGDGGEATSLNLTLGEPEPND